MLDTPFFPAYPPLHMYELLQRLSGTESLQRRGRVVPDLVEEFPKFGVLIAFPGKTFVWINRFFRNNLYAVLR